MGQSESRALAALNKTTPHRPIRWRLREAWRTPQGFGRLLKFTDSCEVGRSEAVVLVDFVLHLTRSHSHLWRFAHTGSWANMAKMLLAYGVVKSLWPGSVAARAVGHPSTWPRLQTLRHLSVKVRKESAHQNAAVVCAMGRFVLNASKCTKMSRCK